MTREEVNTRRSRARVRGARDRRKENVDTHEGEIEPVDTHNLTAMPDCGIWLLILFPYCTVGVHFSLLVRLAALRPGERVLDVACGTGVVARLASEQVGDTGTVAGLDLNPGMLAVARTATPPRTRIEWYEASAESMPMPDASFDVVLCQMGLQFVPDKSAALQEIRRVLVPGGRLLFNVPGPTPPLFKVMGEALARQMGAGAAGFVDHVFSLHDTAEIQELVAGAGFHDVSVAADTKLLRLPPPEEFLWQYVHSTPLAGAVAHVEDDRRRLLERDVVAGWREFVNDSSLDLLVRSVVATARK